MKLTKSQLKQIIVEELENMTESPFSSESPDPESKEGKPRQEADVESILRSAMTKKFQELVGTKIDTPKEFAQIIISIIDSIEMDEGVELRTVRLVAQNLAARDQQ